MAYKQCGLNILRQIIKDKGPQGSERLVHPLFHLGQGLRFKKLAVILTTNIDKLGKAGETVSVAPGYFRNYLMPRLYAVPNIPKYALLIRDQLKLYQPEKVEEVKLIRETQEDQMKEYQKAAKRLSNGKLVLRRFIKVDNELRLPVTKDEIVSEVARQLNVQIEPSNLHLPAPLVSLGEFEVPLLLPRSIPLPEGKLQWRVQVKIRKK